MSSFGKIYFFTLENAKTLRKILNLMLTECFLSHSVWLTRCVAHGQQNARSQNQSWTPPHMAKNKLLLNEYLDIFMHFESTFFLKIWKMDFFRPTHPLNLENSSLSFSIRNLFIKSYISMWHKSNLKTKPYQVCISRNIKTQVWSN